LKGALMDKVVVIDFGGQYAHLIANRIRRLGVYSEIALPEAPIESLRGYRGIILSGSPHSVLEAGSPTIDPAILSLGIPVLGLCYGHQLLARMLGGVVAKGSVREYGRAELRLVEESPLFAGLDRIEQVWMSHGDTVEIPAAGFDILASTDDCPAAAVGDGNRKLYGLQFHPEVTDTPHGLKLLDNFLNICDCARSWNPGTYADTLIASIRKTCGERKVFLLVSGGVDSSVAFALLTKAIGPERVMGLHIDNGLMRHNESTDILDYLGRHGFNNLKIEDATEDFLTALRGIVDPEEKRRVIGKMFIDVKDRVFAGLSLNPDEWLLAQGTIYPDTIESAGTRHADRIKTHHNRVDAILELIERGLIIEPLAQLYKDEVRELGEALGLPKRLVWRHPFPGPGLGVRVLCSDGVATAPEPAVTAGVSALASPCGYQSIVLPVRSVGVQGDGRTYAHPALLTGPLDWERLGELSTRITNAIRPVNRVVYCLTEKPARSYRLIAATITRERLTALRAVDHIVTEALIASGEYDAVWQMPVVLLPLVNDRGGECVVLRPIVSQEAMTARFVPLMRPTLDAIIEKAAAIKGIGDLFIDITHKPPATIEWE
jgi:GMP synthase (glutamine-hydrolysing)